MLPLGSQQALVAGVPHITPLCRAGRSSHSGLALGLEGLAWCEHTLPERPVNKDSSSLLTRKPKRARTLISKDPDLVMPPRAAQLVGLSYPEQFNAARWSLEEGVNPATGSTVPIPDHLRVPYLTTAQIKKLTDAERAAYVKTKAERLAWTRAHWMRVSCWGGRATPNGEYRYSARLCQAWAAKMRGVEPSGPEAAQ